jgi:hypothetical protein
MTTASWKTPGTSGNWSAGANWNGGTGVGVTIASNGTAFTVTLDVTPNALDSLTLGTAGQNGLTFAVGANTLNVNSAGTKTVTLTDATLTMATSSVINATTVALAAASSDTAVISGAGKIAAAVSATGAGTNTITATGGTLEVTGAITNGGGALALTIGSGVSDSLKLDGASAAKSLTFSGSAQTLEINTAGSLTLTNALAIGSNTVKLDATASALTDNAGISISTGTITGAGKITGAVTATGAASITATSSGTLEFVNSITDSGNAIAITIANGASNKLLLDATSAANSVTFGAAGTLELNTSGVLSVATAMAVDRRLRRHGQHRHDHRLWQSGGRGDRQWRGHHHGERRHARSNRRHHRQRQRAHAERGRASNKLLLDAASAAHSVTFGGAGKLELNTSGSLTAGTAIAIGTGTVQLDASGTVQLTDSSGISLAGGTLSGTGLISSGTAVTGSGAVSISVVGRSVTASGGTLGVTGSMDATSTLAIADVASSVLKIDNTGVTIAPVIRCGCCRSGCAWARSGTVCRRATCFYRLITPC